MRQYNPKISNEFEKQLKSIIQESAKRRILKVMDNLLKGVKSNHPLHNEKSCYKTKYVGENGYRIAYCVCLYCRNTNECTKKNACSDCERIPDNTILFKNLMKKTDAMKHNW